MTDKNNCNLKSKTSILSLEQVGGSVKNYIENGVFYTKIHVPYISSLKLGE